MEAPIGDFDVVGDLSDGGSFRDDDRRLLTSPKTEPIIRNAFRNVPDTIDLIIAPLSHEIENVSQHAHDHGGVVKNRKAAAKQLGRPLPAPSTRDAITVIYTNNEGANRLPMTAWIIAHRMLHAISAGPKQRSDVQNVYQAFVEITQYFEYALDVSPIDVAYAICTMRSARKQQLNGYAEAVIECFAQWLLNGAVKFNRFTDPVTIAGKTRNNFAADANKMLAQGEVTLGKWYRRILDSVKGKVLIL